MFRLVTTSRPASPPTTARTRKTTSWPVIGAPRVREGWRPCPPWSLLSPCRRAQLAGVRRLGPCPGGPVGLARRDQLVVGGLVDLDLEVLGLLGRRRGPGRGRLALGRACLGGAGVWR